jgi:hypothetical protein
MLLTDAFHLSGLTPYDPRHLSDEIERRKMDRMLGRSKPSRTFPTTRSHAATHRPSARVAMSAEAGLVCLRCVNRSSFSVLWCGGSLQRWGVAPAAWRRRRYRSFPWRIWPSFVSWRTSKTAVGTSRASSPPQTAGTTTSSLRTQTSACRAVEPRRMVPHPTHPPPPPTHPPTRHPTPLSCPMVNSGEAPSPNQGSPPTYPRVVCFGCCCLYPLLWQLGWSYWSVACLRACVGLRARVCAHGPCAARYTNKLLDLWLVRWRPLIGVRGLQQVVTAKVTGGPMPSLPSPDAGTPRAPVIAVLDAWACMQSRWQKGGAGAGLVPVARIHFFDSHVHVCLLVGLGHSPGLGVGGGGTARFPHEVCGIMVIPS